MCRQPAKSGSLNVREIVKIKPTLKAYINEAIEVEKAGLKVDFKKSTALQFPEEFQTKLIENSALKTTFINRLVK